MLFEFCMNFLNIEKILFFIFLFKFNVFSSRFMIFLTFKNNNIEKCPFTYWLNGRWFLQIVDRDSWNLYPLYPLFPLLVLILYLKCGGDLGGGGGCNVFLIFYAIYNISRRKNKLGIQIYINFFEKNNYFSFNVFFMFFYAGNIEKCPFTYWLNGRWFLQIVDIHVGNFNMKSTGRWFPQIVDRDSGNLYPIYIKQKLWC